MLTIDYHGVEYKYIMRCIQKHVGIEDWWLWTGNKKRMLCFKWNTATRMLTEDLLPGQKPQIPNDFLEIVQESFRSSK